ncbi:RNase H family protein [Paracoccus sediminis]|nr:RNase H family protein [Paracoccus sediminis]SNR56820.1 Ribonuclease HI [Paracoccus sediminis]
MHNRYPEAVTREVGDHIILSPASYINAQDTVPGNFAHKEQVVVYIAAGSYAPAASLAAFSVLLVKGDRCGNPLAPALSFTGRSSAFTTDQRMVLLGSRQALKSLKDSSHLPALVRSDIQTLVGGLEKWMSGWKRNGWRTSSKKPVASVDLWQDIDALCGPLSVRAEKVKAGTGDPWHERCTHALAAALETAVAEWQAQK